MCHDLVPCFVDNSKFPLIFEFDFCISLNGYLTSIQWGVAC